MIKQINEQANELLARLDRIPIWPFSYFIVIIVGIGFFFAFLDIVSIGLSLPIICQQFNINNATGLWLITSGLIGYIIGSLIDSIISDLFGRRLALLISIAFFSLGSILSATSPNFAWLLFWRFIIGIGIGAEIANVTTYISELSPASCRGRICSIALCMGFLGFVVIPFLAMALVPNFSWGWRALFCIGGIGGIITYFCRRSIPQSIRWYISQKKFAMAETLLKKAEMTAERKLNKALPPIDTRYIYESTSNSSSTSFFKLFDLRYLNSIILFAAIWFVYYIGNYGWLTLSSDLLIQKNFSFAHSLIMISVTSLGFAFGCLFPILISDKIERKWLLILVSLIWGILLLLIGYFPNPTTILIAGFFASASISCLVPVLYIYTAENFPTVCRATGIAITDGLGHLGGAFCGQIIFGIAALLTHNSKSFKAAFIIMAVTGFLTALLLCFGRRLTGKALEQ